MLLTIKIVSVELNSAAAAAAAATAAVNAAGDYLLQCGQAVQGSSSGGVAAPEAQRPWHDQRNSSSSSSSSSSLKQSRAPFPGFPPAFKQQQQQHEQHQHQQHQQHEQRHEQHEQKQDNQDKEEQEEEGSGTRTTVLGVKRKSIAPTPFPRPPDYPPSSARTGSGGGGGGDGSEPGSDKYGKGTTVGSAAVVSSKEAAAAATANAKGVMRALPVPHVLSHGGVGRGGGSRDGGGGGEVGGGDSSTLVPFMHYHQPRFAGVSNIVGGGGSSSGPRRTGGRMMGNDVPVIRYPYTEHPRFAHTPGPVVLHDPVGFMPPGTNLHHGIGAQEFGLGPTYPPPLPPPPQGTSAAVSEGGEISESRGEGGLASSSTGAAIQPPSRRADMEHRDTPVTSDVPKGDGRVKDKSGGPQAGGGGGGVGGEGRTSAS